MKNKNGTQQKIYDEAKKLFFSQGYYNTTVRDITNKANVNSGLFNYYFQNKYNLAVRIYDEIFYKIEDLTHKYYSDEENPAVFMGVMMRMHTYVLNDDKIIKFVIDASKEGILEESILHTTMKLVKNISNYYEKDFSDEALRLLLAITLASERAAIAQKYFGHISYDLEKMAKIILKIHLNGFELDKTEIEGLVKLIMKKFNVILNDNTNFVDHIIW